jgi:hypothetical protein
LTKEEYKARLTIFKANVDFINQSNKENKDFTLGVNSFADMSDDEYKKRLGLKSNPQFDDEDNDDEGKELSDDDNKLLKALSLPASIDWRT